MSILKSLLRSLLMNLDGKLIIIEDRGANGTTLIGRSISEERCRVLLLNNLAMIKGGLN